MIFYFSKFLSSNILKIVIPRDYFSTYLSEGKKYYIYI